ncbi:hypothetical protein EVAR_41951_1 [Eumeta japonica]|uniref:Uncharacterized protein n=1 Tax=Eumeta variegata TaxID=151549 RepID=A0A4C1WU28_EUMVA|nr:hypothetical protein EVAR_41951_1 [Eumeta japonica]
MLLVVQDPRAIRHNLFSHKRNLMFSVVSYVLRIPARLWSLPSDTWAGTRCESYLSHLVPAQVSLGKQAPQARRYSEHIDTTENMRFRLCENKLCLIALGSYSIGKQRPEIYVIAFVKSNLTLASLKSIARSVERERHAPVHPLIPGNGGVARAEFNMRGDNIFGMGRIIRQRVGGTGILIRSLFGT